MSSAPYPPPGFLVIRHVPRYWNPRRGEVLTGYPCDRRVGSIGILVTSHADDAFYIYNDLTGPITCGEVVHVVSDTPTLNAIEGVMGERVSDPVPTVIETTLEIALRCEQDARFGGPAFSIAMVGPNDKGIVPDKTLAEALTHALSLRPAPAPAVPSSPPAAPATPATPASEPATQPAQPPSETPANPTPSAK